VFVDVFHDLKNNVILASERINGKRELQRHQPTFFFYFEDPTGKFISIDGTNCSKFTTNNYAQYKEEIDMMDRIGRKTFEADVKPLFKALEQFYFQCKIPELNIALFDIETDFDPTRGFSSAEDAFMPITAISIYQSWTKKLHTLVLKPKLMRESEVKQIVEKFENTTLCDSESQLLDMFLTLIEEADIFSGWNSSTFDIPYIVHRIIQIRGKPDTTRLSLWRQYPKKKEFDKFGEPIISYEFSGRLHLDYLDLYRKYTYHELPSYRLDYVSSVEVGENKTQYAGTLDELYNKDFEKFIEYSRQDVNLLRKIDEKNKYINLVNFIAHENLVTIPTVMGAVALSDNAIILEAHSRNMVVPSRIRNFGDEKEEHKIAGAFVMDPNPGVYNWIASLDIASLYPSTFRALNMSPETIVGQVRQEMTSVMNENKIRGKKSYTNADIWGGVFEVLEVQEIQKKSDVGLILELESGEKHNLTAKQIWDRIIKNNWMISANGTIFRTDIEGIVPSLLSRWFNERTQYQNKLKSWKDFLDTEAIDETIEEHFSHLVNANIKISEGNTIDVKIDEGLIAKVPTSTQTFEFDASPENIKKIALEQIEYWDKRQLVTKIMLNSVYGALVNAGCRFFDQRMGQSCTLTGRCITRHMGSKINEILTGEYKIGDVVKYSDTDSIYFSVDPIKQSLEETGFVLNKDTFIDLSNSLAEEVNQTFSNFLKENFNVPKDQGEAITCVREICAIRTMFVKKKRYAALVYDEKGKRKDKTVAGELKIMGMETERSDTPEWVQSKLEEMLMLVLEHNDEEKTMDFVKSVRREFEGLKPWEKGTPKRVNNLKYYHDVLFFKSGKDEHGKNMTIPGHVRASINWNKLRDANEDYASIKISDGQKIIVCKLKGNSLGMTSIAYPIDQLNLPEWFMSLPFDSEFMVESIVDKKVENIIGVLGWDLSKAKESQVLENLFSWK
jgi:DNA polymerase elongation subunit (family B)